MALTIHKGQTIEEVHRASGYPIDLLKTLTGCDDAKRKLAATLEVPELPSRFDPAQAKTLPFAPPREAGNNPHREALREPKSRTIKALTRPHVLKAAKVLLPEGIVAVVPVFGEISLSDHKGKVAVVTGGNGGIGLEACRQLGRQGFAVILTARNESAGNDAATRLRAEGLDVMFHPLDVTQDGSVGALATFLEQRHKRVDILVNCAGVSLDPPGSQTDGALSAQILESTMAVNTYGPLRVTNALLPLMRQTSGGARVINISSELATSRWQGEGFFAYRTSKAALNLLTQSLARQLEQSAITVNAVDPGWVKTRMGGPGAPDSTLDAVQALMWLATTESPPTGGFFRRSKEFDPGSGRVAIEKEPW